MNTTATTNPPVDVPAITLSNILNTLEPLLKIADFAKGNYSYQHSLACRLIDSGRPVQWMTVNDLLQICAQHETDFINANKGIQS